MKAVKPLPAPIDMPGKRRGGKRVRKMKERYAVTEMRKQANRMTFGEVRLTRGRGTTGERRGKRDRWQGVKVSRERADMIPNDCVL